MNLLLFNDAHGVELWRVWGIIRRTFIRKAYRELSSAGSVPELRCNRWQDFFRERYTAISPSVGLWGYLITDGERFKCIFLQKPRILTKSMRFVLDSLKFMVFEEICT